MGTSKPTNARIVLVGFLSGADSVNMVQPLGIATQQQCFVLWR